MRIEIISCSSSEPIATYSVPNLSMLDFQEWKETQHEIIPLNDLMESVAKLDSRDSETEVPISAERAVAFYLPDPLKNQVFSRIDVLRQSADEENYYSEDMSETDSEGISVSVLKSSTVLFAAVTEILLNHSPCSKYKVKITDG